jgi:hypothetical protein
MKERGPILFLACALAAGLGLRLAWLQGWPTEPVADFAWYLDRAREIASGRGYQWEGRPTAYWPVGWPGFLGAALTVFGPSLAAAKAVNLLLGWLLCALAAVLAWRWSGSRWAAALAAAWCAVHPVLIGYSSILASEPLFSVLLLAALLAKQAPVSGIWWGAACLVRPQALLFLPIMGLLRARCRLQWTGRASLACLIVISPWLVRCLATHKSFIFISANGGENLLIGALGDGYVRPKTLARDAASAPEEARLDREMRAEAARLIAGDPAGWIAKAPSKLARTFAEAGDAPYWAAQTRSEISPPARNVGQQRYLAYLGLCQAFLWAHPALWMLALAAAITKKGAALRLPLSLLAAQGLLAAAFFGNPRFGFPMIPLAGAAGFAGAAVLAQRWVVKVVK